MADQGENRKPPYASPKSFRDFLDRIHSIPPPERVDQRFLRKLGVARNNEWALLSALKFLGIVDGSGEPSEAFRRLQAREWKAPLRDLVLEVYRPLVDLGGLSMSRDELENYFRVAHSASRAGNQARFFEEICHTAGLSAQDVRSATRTPSHEDQLDRPVAATLTGTRVRDRSTGSVENDSLLQAKLRVLAALPEQPPSNWSPADYKQIYETVLAILENLERSNQAGRA